MAGSEFNVKPIKALGQNFLVNDRYAKIEAVHAQDKVVIELGPGLGILTKELCRGAKRVIAVEKDKSLYLLLKAKLKKRNLKLLNKDFFEASDEELGLSDVQIMIANIPYNLSSKTVQWLYERNLQAVLCLQREFVEHMLAKEGGKKYSKLSVMTHLFFSVTKIADVNKGNFRPIPKVDSSIIYLKPKGAKISRRQVEIIGFIMQHKKRTLRKALIDSFSFLSKTKREISQIADKLKEKDERVFKLSPETILQISETVENYLRE